MILHNRSTHNDTVAATTRPSPIVAHCGPRAEEDCFPTGLGPGETANVVVEDDALHLWYECMVRQLGPV